jgi:hypothetical protein
MVVLAHYWGIDEIGVFVVPALLAIWALRRAEKRARRRAQEKQVEGGDMALEKHDDS